MKPRVSRLAIIRIAALLCLSSMTGVPAPSAAGGTEADRDIPFLTLRNSTGADAPGRAYGDARSGLKAGWCGVRDVDLSLFSPIAEPVRPYIREELVQVDRVREAEVAAIFDALERTAAGRPTLLYTHGFNISFEKGCRRAVLLRRNADLAGRMLWFSWPSDGALINYIHDEADLYWSVPDLADAIIEMDRRFGGGRVNVAGHSLGARGIVLALYEVANRHPETRIANVVLLAPDIDVAIFERMLPRIAPVVGNMTVYVTTGDRPLAVSAQLHGYPRLGEAGEHLAGLAGVEIIDLSDLPVLNPTGHLHHIYNDEVGDDLSQLLNEGKPAAARRNMVRTGANRWRLQPDGAAAGD